LFGSHIQKNFPEFQFLYF